MNRFPQLLVNLVALALGGSGGHFLWKAPAIESTTPWIDIATDSGKRIPFKTVMTQTSGTRVIPLDSGNPDLRVEHLPTQTVAYLDPKLFQRNSQQSSLRTFYYEATSESSKVTEDALHLLLGFPHDGSNGQWKFGKAQLVDLSGLNLKLEVEFSASNKDLYPQ